MLPLEIWLNLWIWCHFLSMRGSFCPSSSLEKRDREEWARGHVPQWPVTGFLMRVYSVGSSSSMSSNKHPPNLVGVGVWICFGLLILTTPVTPNVHPFLNQPACGKGAGLCVHKRRRAHLSPGRCWILKRAAGQYITETSKKHLGERWKSYY